MKYPTPQKKERRKYLDFKNITTVKHIYNIRLQISFLFLLLK